MGFGRSMTVSPSLERVSQRATCCEPKAAVVGLMEGVHHRPSSVVTVRPWRVADLDLKPVAPCCASIPPLTASGLNPLRSVNASQRVAQRPVPSCSRGGIKRRPWHSVQRRATRAQTAQGHSPVIDGCTFGPNGAARDGCALGGEGSSHKRNS